MRKTSGWNGPSGSTPAWIFLAVITAVVLLYTFSWTVALAMIAAMAVVILTENLRELRAR